MSHGDNNIRVDETPDRLVAAGQFGGQRDHPDRAGAGGQHVVDLGWVGITHPGLVVRAATRPAQPRPLQMNARDDAVTGRLGECAYAGQQFGGGGGDQTGQRRGGAVA